jgi:hypothetical protein
MIEGRLKKRRKLKHSLAEVLKQRASICFSRFARFGETLAARNAFTLLKATSESASFQDART